MTLETQGVAQTATKTPMAMVLRPTPQNSSTSLNQFPESAETRTISASTTSQRRTIGIPHNTALGANHQSPENAVRRAFSVSAEGRRQAMQAASYIATAIYRAPHDAAGLRKACLEWLAGTDLTLAATCAKSGGQAVIKRLNECLDGDSRRVTATLLNPEDIAHLRVFRQGVRELIKGQ